MSQESIIKTIDTKINYKLNFYVLHIFRSIRKISLELQKFNYKINRRAVKIEHNHSKMFHFLV